MDDTQAASGPSYSFRAAAFGAPRLFRVQNDGLHWEAGRHSGRIGYGSIRRVRMSFRPSGMQSTRFMTEIWSSEAPKLKFVSTSTKGMFELVRQDREYREFLRALHARLAASGSRASFEAGLPVFMFVLGVAAFAGAGVGMVMFLLRAIQENAAVAALLVAAFLAFFTWQAQTFFRRNRPGRYTPDALPENLLPPS